MSDLSIGDVALDLAQGQTVVVMDVLDEDAATWSERNDYDLLSNYGNQRLDAQPTDTVYEVVFVNTARSEPSRTYSFPESRLLRLEPEQATNDGRTVQQRILTNFVRGLLAAAEDWHDEDAPAMVEALCRDSWLHSESVDLAVELHEAERLTAGGRGE